MIEISKISKRYQDTTVLDNITTTIQRGGILRSLALMARVNPHYFLLLTFITS